MSDMIIQVRGAADEERLREAVSVSGYDLELQFVKALDEDFGQTEAARVDALICFVEAANHSDLKRLFGRLRRIVDAYPYVPVIAVDVPPRKWRSFTVLGVARLLARPRDDLAGREDYRRLLEETVGAIGAAWWWGAKNFDLPVLIVDREGIIARANEAAVGQFRDALVGQPYRRVVEKSDSNDFPDDHPIRQVLESGPPSRRPGQETPDTPHRLPRSVSRHVQYARCGEENEYAYLACLPVVSLRNAVVAVAVFFLDLNTWARSIDAFPRLAKNDTRQQLYAQIVQEVERRGYRRVRLYEYIETEGRLIGHASVGLSPEKDDAFCHGFSITVSEDPPSEDTVTRSLPRLWFHEGETGDFYRGVSPAAYLEQLELDGVNRWIEVPLTVPAVKPDGAATFRCWGKMSVDNGADSDRLGFRDVADLGVFATFASSAIAASENRRYIDLFGKYSDQMVQLKRDSTDKEFQTAVINLLLKALLELTGGDTACFRELTAESLRLVSEPVWRDGSKPDEMAVPRELTRGEGYAPEFLDAVTPGGAPKSDKDLTPTIVGDASPVIAKALQHKEWEPEYDAYLRKIHSVACVPLVIQQHLRSVISATAWGKNAFSPELQPALSRFMDTASLWFEFSELHTAWSWSAEALSEVMAVLPELVGLRNREAFHAALAAILSSHVGLLWNRVLVFECREHLPGCAELVYALGGLGDAQHMKVIDRVKEEFKGLKKIVEVRIKDPVPHGVNSDTHEDQVDPLFRKYIQGRGDAAAGVVPVRIDYGPDASTDAGRWLNEILTQQELGGRFLGCVPLPNTDVVFRELQAAYPELFRAECVYVFPVWQALAPSGRRPLALIVVDAIYTPTRPLHAMRLLTRAVLDLAGDILSYRDLERKLPTSMAALPMFTHGWYLKWDWDLLRPDIDRLLVNLENADGVSGIVTRSEASRYREKVTIVNNEVQKLSKEQKELQDLLLRLNTDEDPSEIPDLGKHLQGFARDWEKKVKGLSIEADWNQADGRSLTVDPYQFDNALRCVLDNAISASRKGNDTEFQVRIGVAWEPWPGEASKAFLVVRITDTGHGIPEEARRYIFVDGFTFRRGQPQQTPSQHASRDTHSGLGLGLTRGLVAALGGDIQVDDWGRPPDIDKNDPGVGATFVLRIPTAVPTASFEADAQWPTELSQNHADGIIDSHYTDLPPGKQ